MDYKGNLRSAILALIIGLVLVFYTGIALHTVVLVVGIVFIATGVFNLIGEFSRRDADGRRIVSTLGVMSAAGAALLGVLMVCTPQSMINLMVYAFAAAFILLGLYLIFTMAVGFRPVSFPFWFYILPSLLVINGVAICIIGAQTIGETIIMIAGISLIVYSIASFIEIGGLITFRRNLKRVERDAQESQSEKPDVS